MKILITGGAGFIGSNLVDHFLSTGHKVVCLDDLSTGFEKNIEHNYGNPNFKFFKGDIRDIKTCRAAVDGCNLVSHQAALGSVPRSIADPLNTNSVNIDGFLNILIAARDEKVKRFVYAASSSTYGDSNKLPKVEEEIGKPLSPYAVTKYVNELYADVFSRTYGMECIGLRYFNVFGRRQDPNGAYAAVIPLWAKKLINHENPVINGDGSFSRDFTYIDNVIDANEKALFTPTDEIVDGLTKYYNGERELNGSESFSEVLNIAYGEKITLLELFNALRANLGRYNSEILKIEPVFGPVRAGDIPHSQASIRKAEIVISYSPLYNARKGFELAARWYFENMA